MRTATVRLAAISAVVLAALAGAPVQSTQSAPAQPTEALATLPTAKELLDRHIKAIGGRQAIMTYSSRRATGTMSIPANGIEAPVEINQAKPNKWLLRITLPGVGTVEEGFDGTHGWTINEVTGPVLLQGKQLEDRREDADFEAGLDIGKTYTAMKTVERAEFDGRQCYKVVATRKSGGDDTIYFDASTGLRAGSVETRETPIGALTTTLITSDYKQFDKVSYATRLSAITKGFERVMAISNVEHDNVDPRVFTIPAQIKALVK